MVTKMTLLRGFWAACIIFLFSGQCIGLFLSSHDLCIYLTRLNCTGSQYSGTLCASDAKTYANHCEFSKSLCIDPALYVVHQGPCQKEKEEQQLVLNLTCTDLLKMSCVSVSGTIPYCASNGLTYRNVCYFEKARCFNNDIYLRQYGNCKV